MVNTNKEGIYTSSYDQVDCSKCSQLEELEQNKEGAPTLFDSMGGTGEHYAKWNKPGSETQIPYDLTFNWNIINKGKKQTKYNQKQWN